MYIVSQFLSDGRQFVRLDGKVCASVDVASGAAQGSVLEPLLFILYTCELFRITSNHIVGFADDISLHVVIPIPLSRLHGKESLNQDLAAIFSWCLK